MRDHNRLKKPADYQRVYGARSRRDGKLVAVSLSENGSDGLELLQKPYSIEQLSRVLHKAGRWRRMKRAPIKAAS